MATNRHNAYCVLCRVRVPAGDGVLVRMYDATWKVAHLPGECERDTTPQTVIYRSMAYQPLDFAVGQTLRGDDGSWVTILGVEYLADEWARPLAALVVRPASPMEAAAAELIENAAVAP